MSKGSSMTGAMVKRGLETTVAVGVAAVDTSYALC